MLGYLLMQKLVQKKITTGLLLLGALIACSEEKKSAKHIPVPLRMEKVYQISQQTSYPLIDCDSTVNEIRLWELPSRLTYAAAFFLKDRTIATQWFHLAGGRGAKGTKVIGVSSGQERILDKAAERKDSMFYAQGGPALTCRKGIEAALDSLFKLGFADMQSQSEEESQRVGDGTGYIIEVRRGRFYKYVYYHNPELFDNEPARKFIKTYQFLTQERWRNSAFNSKL
jgi:hypothetical protein